VLQELCPAKALRASLVHMESLVGICHLITLVPLVLWHVFEMVKFHFVQGLYQTPKHQCWYLTLQELLVPLPRVVINVFLVPFPMPQVRFTSTLLVYEILAMVKFSHIFTRVTSQAILSARNVL
jgi:hypothetical protein